MFRPNEILDCHADIEKILNTVGNDYTVIDKVSDLLNVNKLYKVIKSEKKIKVVKSITPAV